MSSRTNEAWLTELRGPGKAQALADLRAILVSGLRYALGRDGSVTELDLEDFAQEALLKILDGLDTFRGESKFVTWAQKIAVRVALTELRRRRWKDVSLHDLVSRYEGDFTPTLLADSAYSPEQRVIQQMLIETVFRSLDEDLTPYQRQAILAILLDDVPLTEIARRLGINRNALYKRIHDARQKLKQELLAQGLSIQDVMAAFETSRHRHQA